jgi:4-diphosphocytidyl-2-C-methyl-D-erythritol kinase
MVKLLAEHAPAKINLCLRIAGKRADGNHELDSIFLPITWSDIVRLEMRPCDEIRVALHCDSAVLSDPQSNLASRAALAFMREYGFRAEVSIDLRKRIPMGAGLGGGSSDAGAVLRMMARIFHVPSDARLGEVAVKLGADVPFFLDPRPARVRGIGERIEPIAAFPGLHLVVAVPTVEVPTARIFRALSQKDWSGAIPDPDLTAMVGGKIVPEMLVNDLAAPAIKLFPEIAKLKALLEEEGALAAVMSGSGGAVFGLYADAESAEAVANRLGPRLEGAVAMAVATTSLDSLSRESLSG